MIRRTAGLIVARDYGFSMLSAVDLGRMSYADAYAEQVRRVERVISGRTGRTASGEERTKQDSKTAGAPASTYPILLVEHDPPVITMTRRAAPNLIATPDLLARHGVEIAETDRGGDITYHGPGQLVVYPILDLNALNLGLHAYMRMLEEVVIRVLRRWRIVGERDAGATGVWVAGNRSTPAKIAAMGVRVRKWVSMHGLALNVTTNLEHFNLIVPCGLVGRPVTSMEKELRARGELCPSMAEVKQAMVDEFEIAVREVSESAKRERAAGQASKAVN